MDKYNLAVENFQKALNRIQNKVDSAGANVVNEKAMADVADFLDASVAWLNAVNIFTEPTQFSLNEEKPLDEGDGTVPESV